MAVRARIDLNLSWGVPMADSTRPDDDSPLEAFFAWESPTRSGVLPTVRAVPPWRGDPRFVDALPMLDSFPHNGSRAGHSQVFPLLCDLIVRYLPLVTAVVIETYDGGSQMTVWCGSDVPRYQRCVAEARAWSSLTHTLASRTTKPGDSSRPGPEPNERFIVIPLNVSDSDTCFVQFEMKAPIDVSAIGFLHHAVQRACAAGARAKGHRALG
jgi:hypothetical protein